MKYLGDGIYEMGDGQYAVKTYVKGKGWSYEAKTIKTTDLKGLKKSQKAQKDKVFLGKPLADPRSDVVGPKKNNYPYKKKEDIKDK